MQPVGTERDIPLSGSLPTSEAPLLSAIINSSNVITIIQLFMKNSSLLNKDLALSEEQFGEAVTNDFIGTDFIDRLEWAMLMIQQNFNQMRLAEYLPPVT